MGRPGNPGTGQKLTLKTGETGTVKNSPGKPEKTIREGQTSVTKTEAREVKGGTHKTKNQNPPLKEEVGRTISTKYEYARSVFPVGGCGGE